MKRETIVTIISFLLIFLFLYASVSKLLHPNALRHDMYNQPFPHWLAGILIWAVPTTEILISLTLLIDKSRLAGLRAASALMGLFTLYTVAILTHLFGRVPCSCGGVIRMLSWPEHLVFNLFFLSIAILGIVVQRKHATTSPANCAVYT